MNGKPWNPEDPSNFPQLLNAHQNFEFFKIVLDFVFSPCKHQSTLCQRCNDHGHNYSLHPPFPLSTAPDGTTFCMCPCGSHLYKLEVEIKIGKNIYMKSASTNIWRWINFHNNLYVKFSFFFIPKLVRKYCKNIPQIFELEFWALTDDRRLQVNEKGTWNVFIFKMQN
jgi:hypothetical protein